MDAYGIGAVLHQLLTGQTRNRGATLAEALEHALNAEPPDLDGFDPVLGSLCNALCNLDADLRPELTVVVSQLRAWLRNRPAARLLDGALETLSVLESGPIEPGQLAACDHTLTVVASELGEEAVDDARQSLWTLQLVDALDKGQLEAAESALPRVRDPGPLSERIRALREERADVERRAAQMDVSVGRRERVHVFLALLLGSMATIGAFTLGWVDLTSVQGAFVIVLCFDVLLFGVFVALRHRLFANRASSAVVLTIAMNAFFLTFHRFITWTREGDAATMYAVDLALIAEASFIIAFALEPALLPIGALTLCGYLGSTLFPSWAPEIYGGTVTVLPFVAAWSLFRRADAPS